MHSGHLNISAITLVIRDVSVLVTHLPREVAAEENKAHSSPPPLRSPLSVAWEHFYCVWIEGILGGSMSSPEVGLLKVGSVDMPLLKTHSLPFPLQPPMLTL